MEDTLVLETSAFVHESSNLSIPTKRFMETWPSGLTHRTANTECPRRAPSVRIGSSPPDCLGRIGSDDARHQADREEQHRQVFVLPLRQYLLHRRSERRDLSVSGVSRGHWRSDVDG